MGRRCAAEASRSLDPKIYGKEAINNLTEREGLVTIEELKTFLSNLTVIEACKLALDLEDTWGVKRPGSRPEYRMFPAYGGAPMPRSSRSSYLDKFEAPVVKKYYLTGAGSNPVYTMKILREYLGWDLAKVKSVLASGSERILLLETDEWRDENIDAMLKDLKQAGAEVLVL